jgi:Flp pilus assembly protein TadB
MPPGTLAAAATVLTATAAGCACAGVAAARHRAGADARRVLGARDGDSVVGLDVWTWMGRSTIGARLPRPPSLQRRLILCGERWSADQVAGVKVAGMSALAAVAVPSARWWAPGLVASVLLLPAVFRVPDLWIARVATRRQAAVSRQTLDFVELLVAATEAGLPAASAFRRAAALQGGALGEELSRAAREIDLGVDWRAALGHLVERTEASGLRRLSATLTRAHRLGTSARGSLRAIADELRSERRARAEESARRAPVKMLFPLVFLILPAFLLLTVGPVLLATVRSLR